MFLLYSQPSKKVQWMELLFPFVILLTATLMNSYLSLSLSNSLLSVALPSFWMIHIDWLAIPWWKKSRGIKCTKREDPTSWQCSRFFLENIFPVSILPLFLDDFWLSSRNTFGSKVPHQQVSQEILSTFVSNHLRQIVTLFYSPPLLLTWSTQESERYQRKEGEYVITNGGLGLASKHGFAVVRWDELQLYLRFKGHGIRHQS